MSNALTTPKPSARTITCHTAITLARTSTPSATASAICRSCVSTMSRRLACARTSTPCETSSTSGCQNWHRARRSCAGSWPRPLPRSGGPRSAGDIARKCASRPPGGCSPCSRHSPPRQTSPSAVTARTKPGVTGRCCGSYWSSRARGSLASSTSPECPRTHLVHCVIPPDVVVGAPEQHLLGPAHVGAASSTDRQEPGRPRGHDAQPAHVTQVTQYRPGAFRDDPTRGRRPHPRDAQQLLARGRPHVDRKPLWTREGRGHFGIEPQRQVPLGVEHHVAWREAVATQQVIRLVQPALTPDRRLGRCLERRVPDRPECAEMRVMNSGPGVQLGDTAEDGPVAVGSGTDDELHGHPRRAVGPQGVARLPVGCFLPFAAHAGPYVLEARE